MSPLLLQTVPSNKQFCTYSPILAALLGQRVCVFKSQFSDNRNQSVFMIAQFNPYLKQKTNTG